MKCRDCTYWGMLPTKNDMGDCLIERVLDLPPWARTVQTKYTVQSEGCSLGVRAAKPVDPVEKRCPDEVILEDDRWGGISHRCERPVHTDGRHWVVLDATDRPGTKITWTAKS